MTRGNVIREVEVGVRHCDEECSDNISDEGRYQGSVMGVSYEEIRKNVKLVLRFWGRRGGCDRVNTDLRMYCAGVSCEDSVLFSKVLEKRLLAGKFATYVRMEQNTQGNGEHIRYGRTASDCEEMHWHTRNSGTHQQLSI